jgi:hypothetical protein
MEFLKFVFPVLLLIVFVIDVLPMNRTDQTKRRLWLWSGLFVSSVARLVPDPFSEVLMAASFLLLLGFTGKMLRDPTTWTLSVASLEYKKLVR